MPHTKYHFIVYGNPAPKTITFLIICHAPAIHEVYLSDIIQYYDLLHSELCALRIKNQLMFAL